MSTQTVVGFTGDQKEWWARVSTLTVAVVGVCAAALSYEGIHSWALQTGVTLWLAWCYPLLVDGLAIGAMTNVVSAVAARTSPTYSWVLVGLSVALSTAINVVAASPGLLAQEWAVPVSHGLPPIILALTAEQAVRAWRHRAGLPSPRRTTRRTPTTPTPEPAATDASPVATDASPVATGGALVEVVTGPKPKPPARKAERQPTLREKVEACLREHPDWGQPQVREHLGSGDPSTIRGHIREFHRVRQTEFVATATGA